MKKVDNRRQVAILVPAHNEEKVIADTLHSLLRIAPARDIFVVNDGSKDKTAAIAKKLVPHVLTLKPNQGKAGAMNTAIRHFKFTKRYKYVMPIDADTKVTAGFLKNTLPILDQDKKSEIACVIGKVIGGSHSMTTAYRLWEYEIAQTIHKKAQAILNAIIVCPGPSTVYRSELFISNSIPTGTLTEDMDFTFLIHRKKLGKLAFTDKAVVITQDPNTVKDYVKQIDRWYTGFWQCLIKHNIPWGGQMLDFEVALLALEGLYNGLIVLAFIFVLPYVLITNTRILLAPFVIDLLFFILPTFAWTMIRHKSWNILKYLPHFYLMRVLGSLVFFKSFIKVSLGLDKGMSWNKAKRYTLSPAEAPVPKPRLLPAFRFRFNI
jgi:biofilm PGA synthesis N-glycosyltransferase PgaC